MHHYKMQRKPPKVSVVAGWGQQLSGMREDKGDTADQTKDPMMAASLPAPNGQPDKPQYSKQFTAICLCLNIALSISIVMINKSIYTWYGFPNITLTCMHFLFTTGGMLICRWMGLFVPKSLPISKMLPISLTFCGFVVFTNLSLQNNTVGTYQIMKCLTTPCIMVIQTYFYSRNFSRNVKLTLIPIGIGVFLNSYYDLKFSPVGIMLASTGVIVTSLYQVWVGEKQKEFNVNSMQLLYYQAPLSAILLLFVIPFFEPIKGYGSIASPWPIEAIIAVTMSGVVAFAVNLSIFWIIGNTSPLTYNMVGHFKFCFTLIIGFLMFKDPIQWKQFVGILCTFSGVYAYSQFKMKEQQEAERLSVQKENSTGNSKSININIHEPYKNGLEESGGVSMEPLPPKK